MVQQCLRADLLDEIVINLVPVTLGDGVRLVEGVGPGKRELAIDSVISAPGVTHLTYRVVRNHDCGHPPRAGKPHPHGVPGG
jgi:riboflavin biosynthesis pyrimidine reductase